MYHSIQYFVENVIHQLEKNQKNFMENPSNPGEYIKKVEQVLLEFGCHVVSETFEECNRMLEESGKRRMNWRIKDRGKKSLLTVLGPVVYTHTRFQHKTTKKTRYLLDQMMGITSHTRLSEEVCEQLILEAAQSSYQKAGEILKGKEAISRESVMRHVHSLNFGAETIEKGKEKKQVKRLYIEADEDHIALQFKKKKGEIKRFKGYKDNHQIIKLIYLHEGYEGEGKRKKRKQIKYVGGLFTGKENEELWKKVKDDIERTYETERLEKIYFQSDGGSWMKKGVEMLGAEFVLDGFHIKKYVKKLSRELGKEESEKDIMNYLEKGKRKKLEEWVKQNVQEMDERKRKQVEESLNYIQKNWKGIRKRIKKEEGILGSSTESHVSHVLSARMSSHPMGWSKKGADKVSQLRIYWKNGGEIRELLHSQRREEKKKEENRYFSASQMISWERQKQKSYGKYIERLQTSVSQQTMMKVYFQKAITEICG